jgi:oligopeptide transport system substrate-binding protein
MDTTPTGIKYDVAAARLNPTYLDETSQTADQLDLTVMFNANRPPAHCEAVQQMWKDNGVNVKTVNQEWAVYLETIKGLDTPQIWRLGWCVDYPDANNFLREVFATNGSSNPTTAAGAPAGGVMWKNDRYEELMVLGAAETDAAKRLDIYAEAEDILVNQDAVIIPFYWYTDLDMTRPYISRTYGSGGHERYEKWDILAH